MGLKEVVENKCTYKQTAAKAKYDWERQLPQETTQKLHPYHSRKTRTTPSSENKICKRREKHLYIDRLEKLPTTASKASYDQPKSMKTEAHRKKPTEIRKNSRTLLDTWARRCSRKRNCI